MTLAGALLLAALLLAALPDPAIWPGETWSAAPPESRGMSPAGLERAARFALAHGGGSGCVIRHGYLVGEWGSPTAKADIKSCTKGSIGTTLLGLAVDDELVRLDDRARRHYPALGEETPGNRETGWLDEITVRHLATMTGGFDDGRPPRLVYRPGTSGIYSNDTSNMLAELLTLRWHEDLRPILKRRVMDPLGIAASEWAWRDNQYRPKAVAGLPSREFASGITITHRALACIGHLYLRGGEWNGQRILSPEYVREATRPTDLPAPFPGYAFYWGTNARGAFNGVPRDAFWALGLGDSFVAVCPSLDLVIVRLGTGSRASQLPPERKEDNGFERVAMFVKQVTDAVTDTAARAPCPPSPVIARLIWDPAETIVRQATDSDNWPLTWADDDALYTAYGDGHGFAPMVPEKLSLGLARVTGGPQDFRGENLRSPTGEFRGDGKRGKKASGILCVGGVLYLWIRNAGNAQLAWSRDRGRTWTAAGWKLTESFGCPTFLNFGRDYAGARDGYVYIYSADADDAYTPAGRMVLARAPRDRLADRAAYAFFVRRDRAGKPLWSEDIRQRGAVFTHPGRCYRSGITYDRGLRRFLWWQVLPGGDTRFAGGFGVYDAPEPWGPWTTVYFTEAWDVGPGESANFPTKWMSADGRTVHLVFSGDDSFSVRRATLETNP